MKKISLLLFVFVTCLACNKDEDAAEVDGPSTEILSDAYMTFVIQGDTIHTDSVYTRSTAYIGYQIGAVAPSGDMILLTMHGFVGPAIYIADNQLMNNGVNHYYEIEMRAFDGASFSSGAGTEGGFINITEFSEESGSVSGSFGGVLYDTETGTEGLVIDTGYFEFVRPIVLETLPGKADVFSGGKLYKNLDVEAVVNANHHFKIATIDAPVGGGVMATLHDFTPSANTWAAFMHFYNGQVCQVQFTEDYGEKFHVVVDSASQTATGYLQYELLDKEIIFNQVPIELPAFSAESDKLNLLLNNEVIPFEDYTIQLSQNSGQNLVEVQAWSSSGKYLEVSMVKGPPALWNCFQNEYSGTMDLYAEENDPMPMATFSGRGNSIPSSPSADLRKLGFISGEVELSGKELEVTP